MSSTSFVCVARAGFYALLIGTGTPILAQPADDTQALRDNCSMDYLRYCAGLSPDGPKIRACFKRNKAKLSKACSSAINAYTAATGQR